MLLLTVTDSQTLQYAISFIFSLYEQNPLQNLRLLPPDQLPSFQDPEIQQTSHSYFCNSVRDTDNNDVERPSKRARLATVDGVQTMGVVRSNIVSKIYSLLGLQDNATLAGLSQNAV